MDRSVIVDINAFIGGFGSIGIAEVLKTPAIKLKKLDKTAGTGDSKISYGAVEALSTEATFKALPSAIYDEIAKLDKAEIIFKKAVKTGDKTEALEFVCKGAIDIEYGEFKAGEYLDVKVTQEGLISYLHEAAGKTVVNIDHENMICEINGKDLMSEVRSILKG